VLSTAMLRRAAPAFAPFRLAIAATVSPPWPIAARSAPVRV
jgi:hypothetical protein